jgi:hypothetical protein
VLFALGEVFFTSLSLDSIRTRTVAPVSLRSKGDPGGSLEDLLQEFQHGLIELVCN